MNERNAREKRNSTETRSKKKKKTPTSKICTSSTTSTFPGLTKNVHSWQFPSCTSSNSCVFPTNTAIALTSPPPSSSSSSSSSPLSPLSSLSRSFHRRGYRARSTSSLRASRTARVGVRHIGHRASSSCGSPAGGSGGGTASDRGTMVIWPDVVETSAQRAMHERQSAWLQVVRTGW